MAKIPIDTDLNKANKNLTKNQENILKLLASNEDAAIKDIAKEYKKIFDKIDKDLKILYEKIGDGKISIEEAQKFNRLSSLLDRTKTSMTDFYKGLNTDLNKTLIASAKNSLFGFSWSLESAINLSLAFDLPNKLAIQIAKDTPFFELAKNRLYRDGLESIERIILQGLKQGKSYVKLSRMLRDKFGINLNQAERIIRTETHRIYSLAHNEEFLQTKKMGIDTYMILKAVIDDRTRQQSFRVDGERSDAEGKFKYPDGNYYIPGNTGNPAWDIHDREYTVQVVDDIAPKERYVKGVGTISEEKVKEIIKNRLK